MNVYLKAALITLGIFGSLAAFVILLKMFPGFVIGLFVSATVVLIYMMVLEELNGDGTYYM